MKVQHINSPSIKWVIRATIAAAVVVGTVGILALSYAMYLLYSERQIDSSFSSVQIGDNYDDVIRIMGEPNAVESNEQRRWSPQYPVVRETSDEHNRAAEKGIRYSLQTWYLPIWWIVRFDSAGHVIEKFKFR